MLQLNPPLPMLTPKGEGFAHILIDYGPESDLYWTVLITATGEIWTFANRDVRASKNITLGRTQVEQPVQRPVPRPAPLAAKEALPPGKVNGHAAGKLNGHKVSLNADPHAALRSTT